ncbi:MAG: sugar phosphate isomerase/epimerase [Actinomycetales bacterium]|nr:sugar phosphate isomerase/epimerase [Actinomycetales bacterium]
MEIGLVLATYFDRSLADALDATVEAGITVVEPCGGGHFPDTHFIPSRLVEDPAERSAFQEAFTSRGLRIAAFACHGNPLHPDRRRRLVARESFTATCELARLLGVSRVDVLSGVPGGGPQDRTPNWIVNSVYPDFRKCYEWQWNEELVPYWREAVAVANRCEVRICMEPHPGDMIYDTDTFLRLREALGGHLFANVDPSHLVWLGIDPVSMIRELGDAVGLAHVKDVSFDRDAIRRTGLLKSCNYDAWHERSWHYRALGYGHPESFWRDYVMALRSVGYDDDVIIEIEDPFLSREDALRSSLAMMERVLPKDPTPPGNWFDAYEWQAADIE